MLITFRAFSLEFQGQVMEWEEGEIMGIVRLDNPQRRISVLGKAKCG